MPVCNSSAAMPKPFRFRTGSFDALICECAFYTFPNQAAAREFFRALRRGGRVGISDLTRAEILPKALDGLLAWVACIGDAQTVEGYVAYLQDAGFSLDSIPEGNRGSSSHETAGSGDHGWAEEIAHARR